MADIKITVENGVKSLDFRTGAAAPIHEQKDLTIKGSIYAPADFVSKRKEQFHVPGTHVLVNETIGTIKVTSNDREDSARVVIIGSLVKHADFTATGINDPSVTYTPKELAQWIKMHRTFFVSRNVAAELVNTLRNFAAKVNKEIETKTDDRANYHLLRDQAVESNLPAAFEIKVPLFLGFKPELLNVEIVIDPEDFSCALISPDAADAMREQKATILSEQVERLSEYAIIYE